MAAIPVVFRKYSDGSVIALLPTIHAGFNKSSCLAFTMDQGKVSVDTSVMRSTVEAKPSEYQELLADIVHKGHYPLKISKRIMEHMNVARYRSVNHVQPLRKAA